MKRTLVFVLLCILIYSCKNNSNKRNAKQDRIVERYMESEEDSINAFIESGDITGELRIVCSSRQDYYGQFKDVKIGKKGSDWSVSMLGKHNQSGGWEPLRFYLRESSNLFLFRFGTSSYRTNLSNSRLIEYEDFGDYLTVGMFKIPGRRLNNQPNNCYIKGFFDVLLTQENFKLE